MKLISLSLIILLPAFFAHANGTDYCANENMSASYRVIEACQADGGYFMSCIDAITETSEVAKCGVFQENCYKFCRSKNGYHTTCANHCAGNFSNKVRKSRPHSKLPSKKSMIK